MIGNLTKILLGFMLVAAISSCEKRSCAHVTCPVNLECAGGACICEDGYEGTDCSTLSSTKYTGNWLVYDNCQDGNSGAPYNVYIQPYNPSGTSSQNNGISINPMFNVGPMQAFIVNTSAGNLGNTLQIGNQTISSIVVAQSGGTYFASTTTSSTPSITLNLNFTDQNGSYQCSMTLYKQ